MPFVSSITGCCAMCFIHSLGGSHGVSRHKTQESFDRSIYARMHQMESICSAVTDELQTVERDYLKVQGWDSIPFGRLQLHTIQKSKLRKYLTEAVKKYNSAVPAKKPIFNIKKPVSRTKTISYNDFIKINGNGLIREGYLKVEQELGIKFPHPFDYYWDTWSLHNSAVQLMARKIRNERTPAVSKS